MFNDVIQNGTEFSYLARRRRRTRHWKVCVTNEAQGFGTIEDQFCFVQPRCSAKKRFTKLHMLEEYDQKVLGPKHEGSKLPCQKRQDRKCGAPIKRKGDNMKKTENKGIVDSGWRKASVLVLVTLRKQLKKSKCLFLWTIF